MDRLYIVVRADLAPGLQLAQACHALQAFNDQHPIAARAWKGNLVCLAVPSAAELGTLACDLGRAYPLATFHEPDVAGELTAVAIHGDAAKRLSRLPLALRRAA